MDSSNSLLILDATRQRTFRGDGANASFQEAIALYLSVPLVEVEQAWVAIKLVNSEIDLTSLQTQAPCSALIEREFGKVEALLAEQGRAMQGQRVLLLVDEKTAYSAVTTGFALHVFQRTHMCPMVIGVQELVPEIWRMVDAILDQPLREDTQTHACMLLSEQTMDAINHITASITQQIQRINHVYSISPPFDAACAVLETLCLGAQETLSEALEYAQVLPIHAVVSRLVSPLPEQMDEHALWELECLARKTYAQARVLVGDSDGYARRSSFEACVCWALQCYGGTDLLALPDEVVRLIECVLEQVGHWFYRRWGKEQHR